jgi:hypothetical protein
MAYFFLAQMGEMVRTSENPISRHLGEFATGLARWHYPSL